MLQLQFSINARGEALTRRLDAPAIRVGRREDNDIVLEERIISAYHAEFAIDPEGGYELRDAGSRNGTFLNGKKVSAEPVPVRDGDIIVFGSLRCAVREVAPPEIEPVPPAAEKEDADPRLEAIQCSRRIHEELDEAERELRENEIRLRELNDRMKKMLGEDRIVA